MGAFLRSGVVVLACLAGLAVSETLYRSPAFRDAAGRLVGRGRLLALAHGKGIYESDLDREGAATASDLIVAGNLNQVALEEVIEPARVEQELGLLQAQFPGEEPFREALNSSGLSVSSLRERIAVQLRGCRWLEKQMAAAPSVSERECRQVYDAQRDRFREPLRFRAAHLFRAAPPAMAPELVEEQEMTIRDLPARLARGEQFSQLAADLSEDEATKARGGDLGIFSAARVAPEFFLEIQKLRPGQTSQPFRSRLGFHIAQLREVRAARLLTFEEARAEISLALENRARSTGVEELRERLNRATYRRTGF